MRLVVGSWKRWVPRSFAVSWRHPEAGQTLAEYGLLLALLAVGVVAAMVVLGGALAEAFQAVTDCFAGCG